MEILPVLDVQKGVVVHAVAGERASYRPLSSRWTPSTQPLEVARALRQRFGFESFYLADLDALQGAGEPSWPLYRSLAGDGFRLLVDAGVRAEPMARRMAAAPVHSVAVALETLSRPEDLPDILQALGSERLVFSLDLKRGRAFGGPEEWRGREAAAIAREVLDAGVRRLIVLDLAAVGTGTGCPTQPLVRQIKSEFPEVKVITGGGVRGVEDLRALRRAGADAALVSTALHQGVIDREDLESLSPVGNF